jgi:hypothetical protein
LFIFSDDLDWCGANFKFPIETHYIGHEYAGNKFGDYLDLYTSGPLTKAELLNRIADGLPVDPNFAKKFRIKRAGKDKNDIFW